jgi:thiol-disulfide isomerase/thioredoxin
MRSFLKGCLALLFWGGLMHAPGISAVEVGDQLLLGAVTTIHGQVINQSDWNQKNTLVEVWATWCPFCRKQNVHLDQLLKKIPPNSLNVLTISVDKNEADVIGYMKKNNYDFPVAMMTPQLSQAIGKRKGVPEVYVLDKRGVVIQKDYGLMVDLDFFELSKYAQK